MPAWGSIAQALQDRSPQTSVRDPEFLREPPGQGLMELRLDRLRVLGRRVVVGALDRLARLLLPPFPGRFAAVDDLRAGDERGAIRFPPVPPGRRRGLGRMAGDLLKRLLDRPLERRDLP